jgi:hypothetical protein
MKKIFKVLSLVIALSMVMALSAMASPISGDISFAGHASTNNNSDFTLATAFTSLNPAFIVDVSGDYSSVPLGQLATFTTFAFSPLPSSITPLWTFKVGSTSYSFDATGVFLTNPVSKSSIDFSGPGMAYITGYDPTPGTWSLTANNAGGKTASFSASSSSVPIPTAVWLLGSGLLGLIGMKKRIKS